ncbi:uncharacterized protein LOC113503505 [Trichoplusia ni]|uniref:Uncharacterized protein LOC113503505 n=1 Tax=Trichoplusia ni TaxID=7111 RepID=A0A7E5WKR7_TRINI|nr:uncharacterized protein LOC113503505 [Trichoplusia ni]XP_026741319.1 uncharacterized protein LOC113503505 [Trichoplusia ni]XP_026741320.1 uncharacterized protein LOC113503505 [Trichoplusia ni]XP_026741321.1 uncharacterized protein LOC113503505 [Trichoplusia ni]XP_026741322.1 uncharacterized protein LOC113503505 [Trichoplusia ni]XP_026741323.1 uncharacterized protein LOC113503505 [Trichoplusia ni]XP_026741324.1 uncharacterized protein LOC113503505 [Trichoplusia ni]XP_026741325.1 uncharacte
MPIHTWRKVAVRLKKRIPNKFERRVNNLLSKSNGAQSDDASSAYESPDSGIEPPQTDALTLENIIDCNATSSQTISSLDSPDSGIKTEYDSDSSVETSHTNRAGSEINIDEEFSSTAAAAALTDIATSENTIDTETNISTSVRYIDTKVEKRFKIDYTRSLSHLDVLDSEDNIHCESDPSLLPVKHHITYNEQTGRIQDENGDYEIAFKEIARITTFSILEREYKTLLGLSQKSMHFLNELSEDLALPNINILITIKKIRLNEKLGLLALQFGCKEITISRIITKSVVCLAEKMKELIKWPTSLKICEKLPLSFMARYSNVVSILECLEIEIDKPFDADNPSLSWSHNKKCHVVKYLISYTPDGLISFVSQGYGGGTSDVSIVEESRILDHVPPNKAVVANKKFEGISRLFEGKKCSLITVHSILKRNIGQNENIKQIRYHVDRIRSRIREFNLLLPMCFDNNFLPVLDEIVVVACGLINLNYG